MLEFSTSSVDLTLSIHTKDIERQVIEITAAAKKLCLVKVYL
jgi:hypothetical protein